MLCVKTYGSHASLFTKGTLHRNQLKAKQAKKPAAQLIRELLAQGIQTPPTGTSQVDRLTALGLDGQLVSHRVLTTTYLARTTDPFIIADTSGLISLVTANDYNHQAALTAAKRYEAHSRSVLGPLAVFTETINVIGKKQGHAALSRPAQLFIEEPGIFSITDADGEVTPGALRKLKDCLSV